MNIEELYRDPTITGECVLQPFKACVQGFGYAFSDWTAQEISLGDKILGCLNRIIHFVASLLGSIVTAALVPVGMAIKFFAQPMITEQPHSETVPSAETTPPSPSGDGTTPTTTDTTTPNPSADGTTPPETDSTPPNATTGGITPPRDWTGDVIESLHIYPGDLAEPNSKLATSFADNKTLNIAFKDHPDFAVAIRNKDIFESGAQVIINAANTHLGGGGGIDGLIHQNGGNEYAKAHRELQTKYNSHYVEGYAAIIESGRLKEQFQIDNVIVVAGPQGHTNQQKENQLYSCYYNSLVLAHNHHKTSIAFPTISTGIFGFPKDRGASISLRAVDDFITQFPDSSLKTISIHFLAKNPTSEFEIFQTFERFSNGFTPSISKTIYSVYG